jgi:hypothetical protein
LQNFPGPNDPSDHQGRLSQTWPDRFRRITYGYVHAAGLCSPVPYTLQNRGSTLTEHVDTWYSEQQIRSGDVMLNEFSIEMPTSSLHTTLGQGSGPIAGACYLHRRHGVHAATRPSWSK